MYLVYLVFLGNITIHSIAIAADFSSESVKNDTEIDNNPAPDQIDTTTVNQTDTTTVPFEQELVREREQVSEEDPLTQRQAQQQDTPDEAAVEPSSVKFYGSVRLRYQLIDSESVWNDGNSRFGVEGRWHYGSQKWIFGRAEAGINLLDGISQILGGGASTAEKAHGDSIFTRLLYVGVETPNTMLVYGKNWSTYYQVASFTDRFDVGGASAAGAFNAGTDGGASGTGRADNVMQTRWLADIFPEKWGLKPFMINLQVQHGQPIPKVEADYGTAVGVSAIVSFGNDVSIGAAINHADVINRQDESIVKAGIKGNAQAVVLGVRWFNENWYLSSVLAQLQGHEATDQGTYFDGVGWEAYGRYNFYKNYWLVSGWNYLEPEKDERQAGKYQIKYGVLGLRYALNEEFSRLVYFEAQLDDSLTEDGNTIGNIVTLGVRWDIP